MTAMQKLKQKLCIIIQSEYNSEEHKIALECVVNDIDNIFLEMEKNQMQDIYEKGIESAICSYYGKSPKHGSFEEYYEET